MCCRDYKSRSARCLIISEQKNAAQLLGQRSITNNKLTLIYINIDVLACFTFNKSEKTLEKFHPENLTGEMQSHPTELQMFKEDFSPTEDTLSQAEKLEKYSGEVDWGYLKPHFQAGQNHISKQELERILRSLH